VGAARHARRVAVMLRAGAIFLVLILALPVAFAHEKGYVNVTGDQLIAPKNCDDEVGFSQGGVCYPAGHIQPDPMGQAFVGISDNKFQPTSGCWQQNAQPCHPFCGDTTLDVNQGWDPGSELLVFVDGVAFGNPLISSCGPIFTTGVWGIVYHE